VTYPLDKVLGSGFGYNLATGGSMRIFVAVVVLGLTGITAGEQKDIYETVLENAQKYVGYSSDFRDFAKSAEPGTLEYQISYNLASEATETSVELSSVGVLMKVYGTLECKADKEHVREIIVPEIQYYSKLLDTNIQAITNGIAYTNRPGVSQEALKLREDVRASKRLLDSIKFE
jgi:hypothetical protein